MLEMTPVEIKSHLANAPIGRLCMAGPDGAPYAIPMPFCWRDGCLYLRVPLKGRKGDILAVNNQVCFEIDWYTETFDDYGSVLVEGRLVPVQNAAEKTQVKAHNEAKYLRLRQGYRPGHGRQTPIEELAIQKIVPIRVSGRRKEPAPATA
jgi:nitroimidazol reductase NimA-like FMN-containing flavoprotein (pyridoxamine 5'-phosphate oxidase superfamily)